MMKQGEWPQMHVSKRIQAVEKYMAGLIAKKAEIKELLMYEICKNAEDAEKEVDRTILYIKDTISGLFPPTLEWFCWMGCV